MLSTIPSTLAVNESKKIISLTFCVLINILMTWCHTFVLVCVLSFENSTVIWQMCVPITTWCLVVYLNLDWILSFLLEFQESSHAPILWWDDSILVKRMICFPMSQGQVHYQFIIILRLRSDIQGESHPSLLNEPWEKCMAICWRRNCACEGKVVGAWFNGSPKYYSEEL